ncbi:MAG: c-type cytochrome [Sphingomonadaceae bacterium]|uniref:c-type cytochrome n=1 Tax=Thermaurantiacus sp. TaxID=2820283 RepID=UPI00298ED947|nr:c-type cytochrome [Thermaurantiacus sp.]MCS6986014.1 c-type cytochrome [Sphingomonadaceae bacterium]MDW8414770.1 c-type cytochrome [Thermaurantiacus sp.]
MRRLAIALAALWPGLAHAQAMPEEDAEVRRGRLLFLQCRACHTLAAGEAHRVGPNLWGVLDRPVGSAAGFAYSPALSRWGGRWTPERLDAFLADPAGAVPGTTMAFGGLARPEDRRALARFLAQATRAAGPGRIPP